MDTTGRVSKLVDDSEVRVDVAPMFGSRLEVIAGDLDRAITMMEAPG